MNFKHHPTPAIAAALLGLLGAGCSLLPIQPAQPDAARYYTLSAAGVAPAVPAAPGPRLMLLRVEVPAYLQHRPMVTRLGENEVRISDEARWAEPLDLGIAAVLNARLEALTGVHGMEARDFAHDYDVIVRVSHCEGETVGDRGTVRFAADIDLLKPGNNREVIAHRSFTAAPAAWDGKDYAALARALSLAVSDLAAEIVAAVPEK
ncbi:MAG TPA: ABC-type transport auxiliary lipoprotein family protein [Opitutaceae bacterium]|nr:ABC-type transport auxiliary lipoprotein family protein [Opitutaceae bacterium]